jgi:V/A-type H+-transporting ATPase subunit I
MQKFNLVAMSYDKDALLNALQKTNATEVKLHTDVENTFIPPVNADSLRDYLAATEAALSTLVSEVETYNKDNAIKSNVLKDGFDVSYSEFMDAKSMKKDVDEWVSNINRLTAEKNELKTELAKTKRTLDTAKIYGELKLPFTAFSDTLHTRTKLGTIPAPSKENFLSALNEKPLSTYAEFAKNEEFCLIAVTSHKAEAAETDGILSDFGFVPCPFTGEQTGEELYASLDTQLKTQQRALQANEVAMYEMNDKIRSLKIYCDYLGFTLEKEELSDKLRATEKTFLLEGYVPEESVETVKQAVQSVTKAAYFEFSEPTEEDEPPTLMKNNTVVKNFEAVTNMYSPPNYRELDPNTVMAFFYSVFLGFIMGDIGYGLVMFIGGGLIYYKNRTRDSGMKRLSAVFAIGGIFSIVWGLLFNSLFGLSLPFMKTIMPDAKDARWTFAGIAVPSVLVISLLIGIVQLFAGYMCRAVQAWRRGNLWDGIFDGVVWAVFSVGMGLAIVGLVEEANLTILAKIGGGIAGVSLVVAMLTAGRKEKFFGKLSKGFGAAYSVINYASDILSYARLYGLMLSGAVIASIVSDYGVGFITGGNPVVAVLGVLLMIVGHAFNLVMSLLSAYIHDARLQYVEFYSRFFEGEGELFTPLGSEHKYIYLLPAQS